MEKEKFRCHPSIIIEKLAIFFLVIIFLIIYNFDDARMLIEGGMTLKRIVIRIIEITIFLAILILFWLLTWSKKRKWYSKDISYKIVFVPQISI